LDGDREQAAHQRHLQRAESAVLPSQASVIASKAAINDHFKTGQRSHTQDTRLFYRARGRRGKSIPSFSI
jgi:hypothetical protein